MSCLTLLLEADRPRALSAQAPLSGVHQLEIGRGTSRSYSESRLEVPDRKISTRHARLVESMGRFILEDLGSKNGTWLNGTPTRRAALVPGDLIRIGHTVFVFHTIEPRNGPTVRWRDFEGATANLSSVSPRLDAEFNALAQLSLAAVPVCLIAGREREPVHIAQSIHQLSGKAGAFEVLGHETNPLGAATLYVDNLRELTAKQQAGVLELLKNAAIHLIVASDIELEACAQWVRADLLAALSARVVRVPSLAQRREDLGLLMGALALADPNLQLTPECIEYCFRCEWPLDVAQLRAVLSAAAQLAGGEALSPAHLPESIRKAEALQTSRVLKSLDAEQANHREQLVRLLESHGGNISSVARELGKARTQVQRWLRRYEIVVSR